MKGRRSWSGLPSSHRRAIIATAAWVPLTHIAVRVLDYRRTMALAEWTAGHWPFRRAAIPTAGLIEPLCLATTRVQRYSPLPGNCLSRSLVLWWQLRRRGLMPDLRLGVSMAGGAFAAHAWVEHAGRVLNDTPGVAQRYAPLAGSERRPSFE